MLLLDRRGARFSPAVPDPGVRGHGPRFRHEPLAQRSVSLSHQANPARQGARRRGARARGHFERYKDIDGDGVCYRTIPGTEHPLSAYFTRGTGHNEKSGYSERPEDWKKNLDRLARKLETARQALPAPVIDDQVGARVGLLAYGGTHCALVEARDQLREEGVPTSYCRVRALPISDDVIRFIELHERIFIVEQNRDAQVTTILKSTLSGELADRLIPITHYNGTPIAAENIVRPILAREKNLVRPGWSAADGEHDNPPVFDEEDDRSSE